MSRNAITLQQKIWNNTIPITECGCWFWMGGLNADGYGNIKISGVTKKAHRISWEAHNGPIPTGMCILHSCDIPCCVNPAHLRLGTQSENIEDRKVRRRGRKIGNLGERNPSSKLTYADISKIRSSNETQSVLAAQFGVTQSQISQIISRKRWGHIS